MRVGCAFDGKPSHPPLRGTRLACGSVGDIRLPLASIAPHRGEGRAAGGTRSISPFSIIFWKRGQKAAAGPTGSAAAFPGKRGILGMGYFRPFS